VTHAEKVLLARVYRCVGRLGTLGPRNPADIGGLARADVTIGRVAPKIASAISSLGFGDLDDCGGYLDDAEAALAPRRQGDSDE
jgi:hypothetical protein